jgi:hypothetical protein
LGVGRSKCSVPYSSAATDNGELRIHRIAYRSGFCVFIRMYLDTLDYGSVNHRM